MIMDYDAQTPWEIETIKIDDDITADQAFCNWFRERCDYDGPDSELVNDCTYAWEARTL